MKKLILGATLPLLALSLAACSNDDKEDKDTSSPTISQEQESEDKVDDSTEKNTNTNDEASKEEASKEEKTTKFTELTVEIQYPTGEKTYEYDKNLMVEEAEIEDERTNEKIVNDAALKQMTAIVEKLTITPKTSEADVKKQIFANFDIDEDYTEVEVDIEFADGTEKEFKFVK
ncbi:YusW family protein [Kurthia sibirica]|uniref:YusW-like protein n=1 Tax=Kurthia sibirica TaxID=202750 RepID=A0A2U3ALE4_9BACL|nr:YusW family protein [Kurthia sibirica]PWI25337.1 hypothetical protein DEX24_08325 [Kurthia sibirica]GEK34417.1 hypothetical protein KSI01_19500 [Kurthia sibirica]